MKCLAASALPIGLLLVGTGCARVEPVAESVYVPLHVSVELQNAIRSRAASPATPPPRLETAADWKALLAVQEEPRKMAAHNAALIERFPVTVQREQVGGVGVHVVAPPVIPPENRDRLLMHLHGGSYNGGGGIAGLTEPVLLAHYLRMKIVSVDYRMPPDSPFPAAVEDAVAVWKELVRTSNPANTGIGGTSAGGGLTLSTVLKLRELQIPLPAAIFAGTPWADLTNQGDTMMLNRCGKPVGESELSAAGRLYAGAMDPRLPLLSPVNGDFTGFPPALLIAGTRDTLLSDTVRVHRRLRLAGVDAELQVFEGMAHADYMLVPEAPESAEAFGEIALFFGRHLRN